MSGGSFNYLCECFDTEQLIEHFSDLRGMAQELSKYPDAKDAAMETEELVLIISQVRVRIETRMNRLRNVWYAVEWYVSGDSGKEQVQEALKKYRGGL